MNDHVCLFIDYFIYKVAVFLKKFCLKIYLNNIFLFFLY